MKTFTLVRNWSGYCRGYDKVTIEAESLEEAISNADWEEYEREVVRDDREKGEWEEKACF